MVQAFARTFKERNKKIYLVMQEMNSNHFAEPMRADQFSSDGLTWKDIPPTINVLGSRYALAIRGLHQEEFDLPLAETRVAIGPSQGRSGDQYIAGRVDKACLEIVAPQKGVNPEGLIMKINLVAETLLPVVVLVRGVRGAAFGMVKDELGVGFTKAEPADMGRKPAAKRVRATVLRFVEGPARLLQLGQGGIQKPFRQVSVASIAGAAQPKLRKQIWIIPGQG
jgi:hypothetical protein